MQLSRRNFLQLSGLALGAAACTNTFAAPVEKRPNVVFIFADDLGKGMLSHFGQTHFTTPNIDALFAQGADFKYAHSCMYCAPARASLMTGYSDVHKKARWKINAASMAMDKVDATDVNLPKDEPYLANIFQQAGYLTAQIGKLEYGFSATPAQMERDGWDTYFGYLDHVACHGFYPPFLWEKLPGQPAHKVTLPGNTHANAAKTEENESYDKRIRRWTMTGKETYAPDCFIARAESFLQDRQKDKKPFFLYYPTTLPHGPVQIPASKRRYTGAGATKDTYWPDIHPEILKKNKRLCYWNDETGKPIKPTPQPDADGLTDLEMEYATMVKRLDTEVGRILKSLQKTGLLQNTIIIFAADNGHELYTQQFFGERCLKGKFNDFTENFHDVFNGNAGMHGLKWNNFQGGINIPFVMYWPGVTKTKSTVTDIIGTYDLIPTFADILGVPLNAKKDGTSIKPLLMGEHLPSDRALAYLGSGGTPALLTNDHWKLRGNSLFNLNTDPQERTDLADTYPDRVKSMKEKLAAIRNT